MLDEDVFVEHLKTIYTDIGLGIKRKKQELTSGDSGLSQIFALLFVSPVDRTSRHFYKEVAAYDEEDFAALMETLAPFYEMSLMSNYQATLIYSNLSAMLQKLPQSEEIKPDERGCYEVLRLAEGIVSDSNQNKGWKLREIRDGKVFTQEMARMFVDDIAGKYRKLLEISKNPYPNSTRINGRLYYWIPTEYLP